MDFSALTKQIESNHQAPKFKVDDRVRITENWSREIFVTDSVLKTNPYT